MTSILRCLLCTWMALPLSVLSAEDSKELLVPVDAATITQLSAKTNYRLRAQLYPAKRYRFVTINYDLLKDPQGTFTITAFDDVSIRVTASSLEAADPDGQLLAWRSEPIDTPVGPKLRVNLYIRDGIQQVPVDVARRIAPTPAGGYATSPRPSFGPAPGAAEQATVGVELRTLQGEWMILLKATRLVIVPVEDDPRFHVVYEVDSSKVANSSHGGPDNERKLAEWSRFMKQLQSEKAAEAAQRDQ